MIIKNVSLDIVCGITSTLPDTELPEVAFAGKSNVGNAGMLSKRPITPPAMNTCAVPNGLTTRAVRGAVRSARMNLNSSFSPLWEKVPGVQAASGRRGKSQSQDYRLSGGACTGRSRD